MGVYIGDTPEQLGSCLTADAVILDGKVITKQQVAELIQQNAELVAQVEALRNAWRASRQALVVELPPSRHDAHYHDVMDAGLVKDALDAAGVLFE